MNKSFKYSSSLWISLLCATNFLFALVITAPMLSTSLSTKFVNSDTKCVTSASQNDGFFDKINSATQFKIDKDFIVNLEEEESEVDKNYKKLSSTFSNVLFGSLTSNFSINNYTVNSLAFSLSKDFIYLPLYTSLYIVFGVFLI
jgi:hypothetical protein